MREVIVIGGGVSGLSAAIVLAEAGYTVQVAARELGEGTTSAVAAAFWYPYHAYPEDQVTRLAAVSLRRFSALAETEADAGVRRLEALEVFPGPVAAPAWSSAADDFEAVDPSALPRGFGGAYRFRTAVIETSLYLEWLQARAQALGVTIVQRTLGSLDEALAVCPQVINCAGLGARELARDPSLHAVRGQIVRVDNPGIERVWIDEHSGPAITYIVPRSRDVVLGGTSEAHQEDRTPDPEHTRQILARCALLEPRLANARIRSVAVGLRPARPSLRLEAIHSAPPRTSGLVIHNYGHGGAGVTLSWGCAEAVLALLQTNRP
ncbi:MAG: FAD-dependent oxidoreductase [Nannocystis sp.]|nr:FAD-dependent oxidoreductase [Nannocystis sp.]MBA3550146.1 FAD-dependent oxidoreductase [Nannocystis sp.]